MQPSDGLVAETQIAHIFVPLHSAVRFRFIVKFLDLQRRKCCQLDVPDARHDMLVDVVFVVCRRGRSDGWLRVVLVPELHPFPNRVIPALRHIDLLKLLHRFLELFLAFAPRPREDALCDWFPRFRIDTRRVAPFPASVLAFTDVTLPVCPFFRHLCSPFRFGNTNNYHRREIKSSNFLKISDIFQGFPFQEKSLFFVYCGAVFAPLNPPEVALTALLEIVM